MRPSESQLNQITKAWPSVKDMLSVPHSKAQYGRMVRFLDSLIDEVGNDQAHPLAALMETVGRLIDSDGSVKGGRLETFMPSGGHWHSGRVLVGARSRITGYRPGAMIGNDLVDFRSDLV